MKRLSYALLLAAMSCSPDTAPLTQLMVVADSNVSGIDAVTVRVEGMDDGEKLATAADLDEQPLPRTVAIVHLGGKLGPITVTAQALRNRVPVVTQRARVSFVSGQNMMLRFDLDASCLGKNCSSTQTCKAGVCEDYHVETDDLEEWPGSVPDHDAGILVGGSGGKSGSGGAAGSAGSSGGGAGRGGAGSGGSGGSGSGGGAGSGGGGNGGSGGSPPLTCTGGCAFDASVTAPHGSRTCDNGVCTLHCDAGYTSADQNDLNGCEHRVTAFGWTPSNFNPGADALLAAAVDKLVINCSGTLDFGATLAPSVSICGQQLQPVILTQSTGTPELVAIAMRSLEVTAGIKFSFRGPRPVVIVVYGDADIDGELDVSAVGDTGAAGSNTGCGTTSIGANGTDDDSAAGGGGGGLGTRGGDGARGGDLTQAAGGLGGQASSELRLTPLRGGCSGGAGGLGETLRSPGGAGGGALQLSAAGSLRIKGVLAAAGGGGRAAVGEGDGGGGGGSGGAILLEATSIALDAAGWLTANGGGGGGGRNYYAPDAGADGAHASKTPAAGGAGTTTSPGGSGAAGDIVAANGPAPQGCYSGWECGGGGGGGGVGRVVLRADTCNLMGGISPTAACTAH